MGHQRIYQAAWNPPNQAKSAQFAPRPCAVQASQDSQTTPTQDAIENEAFDPPKFEALARQFKEKNGSVAPLVQERLSVSPTKKADFWAQRLERAAQFGHNFANMPVYAPGKLGSASVQSQLTIQPYRANISPQSLQPVLSSAQNGEMNWIQKALAANTSQSHPALPSHAKLTGGLTEAKYAQGVDYQPARARGKHMPVCELDHVVPQSSADRIHADEKRGQPPISTQGRTTDIIAQVAGQKARPFPAMLAHTIQQRYSSGSPAATLQRVPATNLGGYPEAERRTVQQSTIPATMLDAAFLLTVFGTAAQNGGATTQYTFGGTTVFDPAIPAALRRGLGSTGAYLAGTTNVLPLGTTQTVVLDLTPYQGPNAMFRFTHLNHTENRVTTAILLIENVGAAPAAIAAVPVPAGSFTVRGQSFIAGAGWNDQQFGGLQAVLGRLPDVVLAEAAGTTFSLRGQGTPDEAGHYDATHDTIEMHQNAFPVSATTYGGADSGMRAITHEIGHLLDLRRLERAWRTFNTGGQTAAGQRTLLAERSLSGSRWSVGQGGNFEQIDVRRTTGDDFRKAAMRDRVRPGQAATDPLTGGPTSYSNTDWQELFAESFSLYINDPRLFALIRPNLFAFFSRRFPLPTAPAATTPTGSGGGSPAPSSPGGH